MKVITGVAIKDNKTRITNDPHIKIYETLEVWKGCRDEPIIAEFIKPKLLGWLNAHLQIDTRIRDKVKSITSYKPKFSTWVFIAYFYLQSPLSFVKFFSTLQVFVDCLLLHCFFLFALYAMRHTMKLRVVT